jgi:transcriptional regulator with XRE-family HTH domain
MEQVSKNLAKTLQLWREKKRKKMEAAAKELGVATATWGHWEAGRRFPGLHHLSCLSQYIGVPVCRLICCKSELCENCAEK